MQILIEEGFQNNELEKFLTKCKHSLIYNNSGFLNLISKHLGSKFYWILAYEKSSIVGALPFCVKDGPLGKVYNSLSYFGSNGGPLLIENNHDIKLKLINEFYENAKINNSCSATLITNPFENDLNLYDKNIDFDFQDSRISQIKDLRKFKNKEDLIASFHNPRPRNIRKAIKEGIIIKQSKSLSSMDFLYKTHVDNISKIGGLTKKKNFFNLIYKYIDDENWIIYQAFLKDKPIAALLVFHNFNVLEYFTPCVVNDYRKFQPLALIIYEAMLDAIKNKIDYWNWGGTWNTQSGVYEFKKKWGNIENIYKYYVKVFNKTVFNYDVDYFLNLYQGFYVLPFNKLNEIK